MKYFRKSIRHLGSPVLALPRLFAVLRRRASTRVATWLHRIVLAEMGAGTVVQWGVMIRDPSSVRVGCGCFIWRGTSFTSDGPGALVKIGDGVQINSNVNLDHSGSLEIAPGCLISEDVYVYTHDHGLDPHSEPGRLPKYIGKEVWIGMRSIVLASCQRIGDRAVVGAAAVVTKDVPDGAIVAGVPAKIIGWRE